MSPKPEGKRSNSVRLEEGLVRLFRRRGWKVKVEARAKDRRVDFVVRRPGASYVVELKVASEGRPDRLVPLMAQAILESQAASEQVQKPNAPLAVVAAPQIPDVVVRQVCHFAARHAPDVAIGLIDLEGLQFFSGPGLDSLNAARPRLARDRKAPARPANPFSDLNQWMLKVLLARYLAEDSRLLHAPAAPCQNASELARAAQVSVMSASRLVRMLRAQGFLHDGGPPLRLVRVSELLQRWQASHIRPVKDVPVRWILSGRANAIPHALQAYGEFACLGLFAAAEALGYGFVRGAPVHVLVEHVDAPRLRRMGLALSKPGQKADLVLRIPSAPESVFRGMMVLDKLKVSDVLQVWLDVAHHPARGKQQAEHLWKRIIQPMVQRVQADAS